MRHSFPLVFIIVVLPLLLASCSRREERLTPAHEKLVNVYADLVYLSETFKSFSPGIDSLRFQNKVDSILSANGLTREGFVDQLKDLARHPILYPQFTEKVRKDLEHRSSKPSSL